MRKYNLFDSLNSMDNLELRLSLTNLAGGAVVPPEVSLSSGHFTHTDDADPLRKPVPAPHPNTGDGPPIVYPVLPPSGPSGPGS